MSTRTTPQTPQYDPSTQRAEVSASPPLAGTPPVFKQQLQDVQGIIVRGYAELAAGCFVLLHVREAIAARRWLGALPITHAAVKPTTRALNVALTSEGLAALGVPGDVMASFAEAFVEGMTAGPRQRVLGDMGPSAPERWDWGGPATTRVDVLLMVYARDDVGLVAFARELTDSFAAGGVEQVGRRLDTTVVVEPSSGAIREHFGFADGISQPFIEGLEKPAPDYLTVKTGEFVLGYPNEYGKLTERPVVPASRDPHAVLPPAAVPVPPDAHDLGLNGTYLVFRQLEQDVCGFWRFMESATRDAAGTSTREARVRLAAKMVGRWPSGAPLALSPDADNSELRTRNDFRYHDADQHGVRCPVGAHVRRTNPRDSLQPEPGTDKSIAVNKRHQLLRRGRTYGKPVDASMEPDALMCGDPAGERGLFFICLNANISRQFEFVQHSWVNSPKFAGLYEDPDPLIGARHDAAGAARPVVFTEQAEPLRRRVTGLPPFVTVRGGAYFFLPGLNAVRYLASM